MITSIGPMLHVGIGFDLLETNSGTPSDYAKWLRKETAKTEEIAKKFLENKDRKDKKYYGFTGYLPEDCERTILFRLSDEEVARVKEIVFQLYQDNDQEGESGIDGLTPDSLFELVCKGDLLWELEGVNAELDDLIFNRYEGTWGPFELHSIDFEHVHYLYDVTYQEYGQKPRKETVELTDEEYIYLLTQRLLSNRFSFNRLLLYRPELAQHICVQLDGVSNEFLFESNNPFLIVFDEINADAVTIQKEQRNP